MKKQVLLTTLFALLISAGSLFAQCTAAFTYTQSQSNVIDFSATAVTQNPQWTYYMWDFGDNQGGWSANPSHQYSVPGSYWVCVTVFDSLAPCSITFCDTVVVTGNVLCNASAVITSVGASCQSCADGSAIASMMNGTGPYSFTWSTGATTQTISGLLPGVYTCCITDANGCTACDSATVGVASSTSCGISFTTNLQNAGYTFFNAAVTGVNGNPSITWSFGDNSYGYGASPWHMYTQSGMYVVCATVTDSLTLCTATYCDSIQVTITSNMACDANFFVVFDSVNTNLATIYNLSTGSSSMSYQWYWGDNTSDTGAYPTHVYQSTGSYMICLIVVDQATACTDTMCQLLWVPRLTQEAALAPFFVNVVPPVITGITLPGVDADWTLFPNPVQNTLQVGGTNQDGSSYTITDMTGRTVKSGILDGAQVDVSSLTQGVYFFTLINENGKISVQRFIRN